MRLVPTGTPSDSQLRHRDFGPADYHRCHSTSKVPSLRRRYRRPFEANNNRIYFPNSPSSFRRTHYTYTPTSIPKKHNTRSKTVVSTAAAAAMAAPVQRPLRVAILENDTPQPDTQARYKSYGGVFTALLTAASAPLTLPEAGITITAHDVVSYAPPTTADGNSNSNGKITASWRCWSSLW